MLWCKKSISFCISWVVKDSTGMAKTSLKRHVYVSVISFCKFCTGTPALILVQVHLYREKKQNFSLMHKMATRCRIVNFNVFTIQTLLMLSLYKKSKSTVPLTFFGFYYINWLILSQDYIP